MLAACSCGEDHGSRPHLSTNAAARHDPTNTGMVRRAFERETIERFTRLKSAIRRRLTAASLGGTQVTVNRRAWEYPGPSRKVAEFMNWLHASELEIIYGRGASLEAGIPWANIYVQTAYRRGISQASAQMRGAGARISDDWVTGGFMRPVHAERLAIAYTQNYTRYRGITTEMDRQISAVMAEGMAEGRGVMYLARQIADRVDKIGITRARVLARTETIRAHADATLSSYEEAGIEGVNVLSEFSTSLDNAVCPICQPLEGRRFSIEEARGMIPVHPNCRCGWIPVVGLGPNREELAAADRRLAGVTLG